MEEKTWEKIGHSSKPKGYSTEGIGKGILLRVSEDIVTYMCGVGLYLLFDADSGLFSHVCWIPPAERLELGPSQDRAMEK